MKTPQIPAMPGMSPLGITKTKHGWPLGLVPLPAKATDEKTNPAMDAAFASMLNDKNKDQRVWAEREWQRGKLALKPQKPCDHGLFSDDANQLDLVEMFHEPTND